MYSLEKPTHIPYTVQSLEPLGARGKYLEIVRQTRRSISTGISADWEVLMKSHAVIVLPITRNNEIILIDQFRYPLMDWELECPAETLDQIGDTPETAAIRALREEIGYRTERLIAMPTYASSGGTTNELAYGFIALDCIPLYTGHARSDDEIIQMNHIPLTEVDRFLESRMSQGQIFNPKMDALLGRFLKMQIA